MGHVSFDLAFSSWPQSRLFADELHAALDFAVAKHR
jgi:hypothetical protein